MERPSAIFFYGKRGVLNDFYYAEFLAYCAIENKANKTFGYQP